MIIEIIVIGGQTMAENKNIKDKLENLKKCST